MITGDNDRPQNSVRLSPRLPRSAVCTRVLGSHLMDPPQLLAPSPAGSVPCGISEHKCGWPSCPRCSHAHPFTQEELPDPCRVPGNVLEGGREGEGGGVCRVFWLLGWAQRLRAGHPREGRPWRREAVPLLVAAGGAVVCWGAPNNRRGGPDGSPGTSAPTPATSQSPTERPCSWRGTWRSVSSRG